MSFPACVTRQDMQCLQGLDLLPLRQIISVSCATPLPLAGRRLFDELSRPDRFRILRHAQGGQILARNATALAEAQRVLRLAYGSSVAFGPPITHTGGDPA